MSRAQLILAATIATLVLPVWAGEGESPHLDATVNPRGCASCHEGHGAPDSPMLPSNQREVCLSCHESAGSRRANVVMPESRGGPLPTKAPFQHPLSEVAFSRRGASAVTCTSCHSPHRGMGTRTRSGPGGEKLLSPRNDKRLEYELCLECHGERPSLERSDSSVGRRIEPFNASFHPIATPSVGRSPSVKTDLAGREVNCTDCHGNNDSEGARGPHGSGVRHILKSDYATTDGLEESTETYALCYSCHDRDSILRGDSFPGHKTHVVNLNTSCATCHDAHGSILNRSLIRFGDETNPGYLSPSQIAGRLAFESDGPGSGACYVTCHGYDHGPEAYGPMQALLEGSDDRLGAPELRLGTRRRGVVRPPRKPRNP